MLFKTLDLKDTIADMLSEDYRERFRAEYKQVVIRLSKLKAIITKYHNYELDFNINCPISVLERQLYIMEQYEAILRERASHEGINLD